MSAFLSEPPASVILTVDALLILLSLLILLRLSRESGAGTFACAILQRFAQAVGLVRRDDSGEVDHLRRRVMEELQTLQQKRMKLACAAFLLMLTLGLLISVVVVSSDYQGLYTMHLTYMLWSSVVVFVLIASCWQFCSSWHAHTTYGLMMITILLFIQLMNEQQRGQVFVASFWFAGCRLALCYTCMDVKAVTFWNVACALCNCWKYVMMRTDNADFQSDSRLLIACECFFCVIALLLSVWMRERMLATFHHHFSIKEHEVEHSTSHLLLEHVYDAVLPVDADMKINGCADRLAAMLKLDSSLCKKGTDVQDFIPVEEDQERFRQLFASAGANSKFKSSVPCMNVHLRDGIGNNLRVEVIGVKFKNVNGEISYKFGVRESSDGQSFPKRDLGKQERVHGRRRSRLGTPPKIEAAALEDHVSSSTLSNTSPGTTRLAASAFMQTSLQGQIRSLVQLLMTWNLDTSWRTCCTFHSYLPQLRKLLDDLAVAPCKEGFHGNVRVQCKACGVLDNLDADIMCMCCNSEAALLSL
eukprot:TRINITY_DN7879_c0_g2_i3.p1 TRINITY_DN7879_c0_g2~~TRINITY_DN7879_c0_g2_i3.p1  ORF type:complete len:546 (-),score=61.34 TRINITY_DN7879_c0_g2_i3:300-1889(-)